MTLSAAAADRRMGASVTAAWPGVRAGSQAIGVELQPTHVPVRLLGLFTPLLSPKFLVGTLWDSLRETILAYSKHSLSIATIIY